MSKPKPTAYVKTANASEADRQAYRTNASAKTIHEKASRLLAEGKVRARFEALRGKVVERAVEKTAISNAWVIEKLVENVERAMQAELVRRKVGDHEEKVPGEYVYNGSVANKALELLGKELGMFIDRKEEHERGGARRVSTGIHRAIVIAAQWAFEALGFRRWVTTLEAQSSITAGLGVTRDLQRQPKVRTRFSHGFAGQQSLVSMHATRTQWHWTAR